MTENSLHFTPNFYHTKATLFFYRFGNFFGQIKIKYLRGSAKYL